MATVSLRLFKKWSRYDDIDTEDERIQFALDAAEEAVVRATHRTLDELLEKGYGQLPLPLQQAVMLTAALSLSQPEGIMAANLGQIPLGATALINQFRKLSSR